MVDAIVSLAVQQLGEFAIQKVFSRPSVREDVEWLRDELSYMQSFIKDAEQKGGGDHRVRQWVNDIRCSADEAVDIIDSFTHEIERFGAPNRFMDYVRTCACICIKEAKLYGIGKEIGLLRKRVHDIRSRRELYGIANLGSPAEGTSSGLNNRLDTGPLRRATPYTDERVVGFEDVTQTLLAELLKEDPRRRVVSVYGMGGLGKTTLARKLYNSTSAVHHFPYRAWVSVSQEYKIQDLLGNIIKSLKGSCNEVEQEKLDKMKEPVLEQDLHKFLEGSRYLVVIDDVWDKEAWERLRSVFPTDARGSKIIITTRNKEIAMRTAERGFFHELRFLTQGESWDLFCQKAFPGDGEISCCPPAMTMLAREMVEKCGGLPLAVVVLGGLLSHKTGLEEWAKVRDHIWLHLENDSVEIWQLLTLSYNDLSPKLKLCFLYLGMFPEDCEIETGRLTRLWMAEEFIIPSEQRMEDVAEDYINELINRSLIQVAERRWEKVMTCRVHDLLRDLAVKKAREVNFFGILDQRNISAPLLHSRRHAIQDKIDSYFLLGLSYSKVRSLLVFTYTPHFKALHMCFKMSSLRVLDLVNVEGTLPDSIGELIHLKFLGLDLCTERFPTSICNLKSLQTLDLHHSCSVGKLPPEICKLEQLRHLEGAFIDLDNIDSLINLQTLNFLKYNEWASVDKLKEINASRLVNFRKLVVVGTSRIRSLDLFAKLESLETLILLSHRHPFPPLQPLSFSTRLLYLMLEGAIDELPASGSFPESLVSLILWDSKFKEDPMPMLESLPNLRSLELIKAFNGNKIVCSTNGFRQLEVIRISDLPELEEWQVEEGAMPVIKSWHVDMCNKLKIIPERLKSVPMVGESTRDKIQEIFVPESEIIVTIRSVANGRFNFSLPRPRQEAGYRTGASPWGVAVLVVVLLVLVSYQSSVHSKWFAPLRRSD
ncbi:hypothetical protein RJ640_017186 [Escallonia rubra]|uniref:Uncharacterized protein n=1 Tax=Escallonia rubra TaxID=112253 RepID=A0AA88RCR6_9ASTE|nr:hypothetical protein RJ640_017186 [Escallonia rubra]